MPYPLRIERTRNRHSRALLKGNEIVIRLARGLTFTEEHRHITELAKRMQRIAQRDRERTRIDPFRPLLDGNMLCAVQTASGQHTFTLQPAKRTRAMWADRDCTVQIGPGTNRRQLHQLLWKELSSAYREEITNQVLQWNDALFRTRPRWVRVRFLSSQWGSRSPRDVITINAALLFLPRYLLNYVIVHELAHRQHQNHGPQFWKLVETVVPEQRDLRRALRKYKITQL